MLQGSPQARPAMMVFISPVTKCSAPSSASAVRYRQSALLGSTMVIMGRSAPYRELKNPVMAPAMLPTPACRKMWVGFSGSCWWAS